MINQSEGRRLKGMLKLLTKKLILMTGLLSLIAGGCSLLGGDRFSGDIYGFEVNMTIGETESLVIEAPQDALQYIYSEVENNKLVVKLGHDVRPSELSVKKIDLVLKSVDQIRISGTTILNSDDLISTETISIGTSGKSEANLRINATKTQVESSGASRVTIAGETEFLDVQGISGQSIFSGYSFRADETSVFASGESTVKTHSTEKLEVSASGKSRILYKGDPVIESHLSGDASIKNSNH